MLVSIVREVIFDEFQRGLDSPNFKPYWRFSGWSLIGHLTVGGIGRELARVSLPGS